MGDHARDGLLVVGQDQRLLLERRDHHVVEGHRGAVDDQAQAAVGAAPQRPRLEHLLPVVEPAGAVAADLDRRSGNLLR